MYHCPPSPPYCPYTEPAEAVALLLAPDLSGTSLLKQAAPSVERQQPSGRMLRSHGPCGALALLTSLLAIHAAAAAVQETITGEVQVMAVDFDVRKAK